jgi:NitT/TauT family transport system substrate-binding protein
MYRRLRRLMCGGAIATVIVLMGLSPANAEELRILYSTPAQTLGIPHYLAIDKGWYKEKGLEIKDIYLTDSGTALRALLAGEGDVAMLGDTSTMQAILGGAKVKVIGSWQPGVDYLLITSKNATDKVGPGLVGLKFASAGGASMLDHMFAMVLKKHGLDATKNERVAIGGHSDRLAAVVSGKDPGRFGQHADRGACRQPGERGREHRQGAWPHRLHLPGRHRERSRQSRQA